MSTQNEKAGSSGAPVFGGLGGGRPSGTTHFTEASVNITDVSRPGARAAGYSRAAGRCGDQGRAAGGAGAPAAGSKALSLHGSGW